MPLHRNFGNLDTLAYEWVQRAVNGKGKPKISLAKKVAGGVISTLLGAIESLTPA